MSRFANGGKSRAVGPLVFRSDALRKRVGFKRNSSNEINRCNSHQKSKQNDERQAHSHCVGRTGVIFFESC